MTDCPLSPLHREDLRKSGLNDQTITINGIRSICVEDMKRRTASDYQGIESAYEIPYGEGFSRFKVFYINEAAATKKERPKYIQSRGTGNRLYIPAGVTSEYLMSDHPLHIVEGEKKTLKLVQEGAPAIGIAGLWNWKKKDTTELISDFDKINLSGRQIIFYPDSDWQKKGKLRAAVRDFSDALIISGADVCTVNLPYSDNEKIGLDDYLLDHTVDDLEKLPREEWHISMKSKCLSAVEELNKKHFVSFESGKTIVYTEDYDHALSRDILHRSSFNDFKNLYCNQKIENDIGELKPLGSIWLTHPQRRQFNQIVLEPGRNVPGAYNLWKGFSVNPEGGNWNLMERHLFDIVCDGSTELFQYVIGWLATMVQFPGRQAEVALVLRGKRGTGKGMLGNYLCKMLGGHSAHIYNAKHLTGNFNAHLRSVIFLFADEAFWAGDKQAESTLKGLITEGSIPIEGKGRDVIHVKNMLHVLMASNNTWVIPAGLEERRFCVMDVSEKRIQDHAYFSALTSEMDNGGLAAMLHYLLNYDLSTFDIRTVPHTSGLLEQKLQSMDDFQQWWYHRLQEGRLTHKTGWGDISCEELYFDYIESMKDRSVQRRSGETAFGMQINKMMPVGYELKKRGTAYVDGVAIRNTIYRFPNIDVCRRCFERLIKTEISWTVPDA